MESLNCPLCSTEVEQVHHALFRYPFATKVWATVASWWGNVPLLLADCSELFSQETPKLAPARARQALEAVLLVTTWAIWKERNKHLMTNMSQLELLGGYFYCPVHFISMDLFKETQAHRLFSQLVPCSDLCLLSSFKTLKSFTLSTCCTSFFQCN